jgi:hypothetical protein
LCLSTKFITDIKRIYILCFVIFEPYYSRYFIPGDQTKKGRRDGLGMWQVWGRRDNVCVVVVGKAEGKRPLGRSRHTWKDNITCV